MKMQFILMADVPLGERIEKYLPQIIELEARSYPANEAASPTSLKLRITNCAEYFTVMLDEKRAVCGFACGTVGLTSMIISGEAMRQHHPEGTQLYLHSVVVRSDLRGKGHGLRVVNEFVSAAKRQTQIKGISLVAKAQGVPLYKRAGFSFCGDSPLRHGSERWFAMELRLTTLQMACVDAFAPSPFSGNSAAVVLLKDDINAKSPKVAGDKQETKKAKVSEETGGNEENAYLGLVAREFNVAETAFVRFDSLQGAGFGSTLNPLQQAVAYAQCSAYTQSVFQNTLNAIKTSFKFKADVKFSVGNVVSEKGQNLGSLAVLAFAKAIKLEKLPTARLWCEHYWNVLDYPTESSHPNIRAFLTDGPVIFRTLDGTEIDTPIEGFDLIGLAMLSARNPEFVRSSGLEQVATNLIKEHLFFSANLSANQILSKFESLFVADEDHATQVRKFEGVNRVSLPLLAILIRDNVVDIPSVVMENSLQEKTLLDFIQSEGLDDQSVRRLGVSTAKVKSRELIASCSLRWFTPSRVEIDLCGHATLAAAHALFFEFGPLVHRQDFSAIHFSTRSGVLIARKKFKADGSCQVELDFPAQTVSQLELRAGLKKHPLTSCFPELNNTDVEYLANTSTNDLLVVIKREAFHNRLKKVNLAAMKEVGGRGVCVTCQEAHGPVGFSSRFFAPQVGIDEDPVTGSTHCFLAPFWGGRMGKTIVVGEQKSERGGLLECELSGDRVLLRGGAFTTYRGEVCLI